MLTQVARQGRQGWEFAYPLDEEFIKRHSELVAKQNQLWEIRYKQLCTELNITSEAHVARRRTVSTSADVSTSAKSTDTSTRKKRRTTSPKKDRESQDTQATAASAESSAIKMEVDIPAYAGVNVPSQRASRTSSSRVAGPPPSAGRTGSTRLSSDDSAAAHGGIALSSLEKRMALEPGVVENVTVDNCRTAADNGQFLSSVTATVQFASAAMPTAYEVTSGARSIKSEQGMDAPPELVNTLVSFLHSALKKGVLSLTSIKNKLLVEKVTNPQSPLSRGVSDSVLLSTLSTSGVLCIPNESGTDQLCAFVAVGDPATDRYRNIILELFTNERAIKRRTINVTLEKKLGHAPLTRDVSRVLKDMCVSKDGRWLLQDE